MSMMVQSGRFTSRTLSVISSGGMSSTGSTTNFTPTGTATGDLLVLICGGADPTVFGGAAAWSYNNQTGGGNNIKTAYKILAAGDVGATHTISETSNLTPFAWVVYRGPTAMTLKESKAQASGSTLDFTGFTLAGTHLAALTIGFSHGGGSATGITFPAGWTTNTSRVAFDLKAAISSTTYPGGALSASGVSGAVCGTLWELT